MFERAGHFDIIHYQADFPAHAFAPLVDTPILSTIHGFSSPRILPMYKPFEDRVHFVAISEADRHPDLRYAATIHHGIRMEDFAFDPVGSDSLLYFGRIHPDKGTAEAIAVARRLGMRLDIYGIIQDRAYFDTEVAPLMDGDQVRYHGPVGGEARIRALGQARALLHLINFEEPFGLSVVEAMACGTPVIATAKGSMPELIEHGLNGFLVTGAEDAAQAVTQAQGLDRADCRRIAMERFSVGRMADEYIALYRSILAGTARDPVRFRSARK